MAELSPCPFCGAGESRIDHQNMWTGMRSQLICVHIRHWCEKPSRSHLCITANTEEEAVAEWNTRAAPPPAGAQQAADEAVFAIVYDDHDRRPEIVVGRAAAEARFERISASWNAHLFGKLKSNSRDDAHASNNIALAAPAAVQGERYSFVCNAGCGVCGVKVAPFEYERTETLEGEHLGSKYRPHIVSSCCGSEVHVYDNDADAWGAAVTLAATPAPEAAPSAKEGEAVQALVAEHARLIEQGNDYAYFELAYTRQTGWMAWITDKPLTVGPVVNPDRKVLFRGQGDSPEEACRDALKGLTPAGGE